MVDPDRGLVEPQHPASGRSERQRVSAVATADVHHRAGGVRRGPRRTRRTTSRWCSCGGRRSWPSRPWSGPLRGPRPSTAASVRASTQLNPGLGRRQSAPYRHSTTASAWTGHQGATGREVDLLGPGPLRLRHHGGARHAPREPQHASGVEPGVEHVDPVAGLTRVGHVQCGRVAVHLVAELDQAQRDRRELAPGRRAGPLARDVGGVQVDVVADEPALADRTEQGAVDEEQVVPELLGEHRPQPLVQLHHLRLPLRVQRLRELDPAVLRQHVTGPHQLAQLGHRLLAPLRRRQEHAMSVDRQTMLPHLHRHLRPLVQVTSRHRAPGRRTYGSAERCCGGRPRARHRWCLPGVHQRHGIVPVTIGSARPPRNTLSDPDIAASGVAYVDASRRSSRYRSTRVAGACGPTTTQPRTNRRENSSTIPITGAEGGAGCGGSGDAVDRPTAALARERRYRRDIHALRTRVRHMEAKV